MPHSRRKIIIMNVAFVGFGVAQRALQIAWHSGL